MGKKFGVLIIMVILFLSACSMNSTSRAWQEKYDLGIQYLAEGDYSTAIVEFSSAIEIEPKYASLYIARGDAYSEWAKEVISDALETVAGGEFIKWEDIVTEENIYSLQELYDNAIIDYETAVNLLENGEATDQSDDTLDEAREKQNEAKKDQQDSKDEFAEKLVELAEKMLEDVPTDEDKELIHEILDEAEEITEDEELINKIEEIREEVDQIENKEQIDDETATIIFQQKLDELVSQYGVFEAEQSGFMQWASDKWLDPSGILSATILDFDSDGALEMLVCISDECPHQAMDYDYVSHQYHISMEVYEIENGMAVNLCSTLFGAYTESEYSSDNQDEIGFDEEMANNEYISANIFEINEEYFIVCEAKSVYFAFTIGQWQSYWIMKYNGVEFQYVGSLTQTAGGNGGYEYTAYSFDNGLAVIDTLYYSEQNEHSGDALYNSIGEAVRAFFGTYDIDTSDFIIDYENADDCADDLQSTLLRSNNITEAFTFINSEINFNYDASANIGIGEYLANLSRGNDLLNIF